MLEASVRFRGVNKSFGRAGVLRDVLPSVALAGLLGALAAALAGRRRRWVGGQLA